MGLIQKKLLKYYQQVNIQLIQKTKERNWHFVHYKTKLGDQLIDENTLMFVAIHENYLI